MKTIYEIAPIRALPRGHDRFDYLSEAPLQNGDVITLPFRGRSLLGLVLRKLKTSSIAQSKLTLLPRQEPHSYLSSGQVELAGWMASEYHTSLGQTLKSFVLPVRDQATTREQPKKRSVGVAKTPFVFSEYLYGEQRNQFLQKLLRRDRDLGHLSVCIFPERSELQRFYESLEADERNTAVLVHGSLPGKELLAARSKIRAGDARILIGTTSVLFEPLPDRLVSLYVDDEINMSYKQSDRQPHYHVRDLALMLFTQRHYSVRFLGVEPSLELVEILREHHGRWEKISGSIPELEITSPEQGAKNSIIGYQLESALRENFERGKRSLLYYNRLGREPGLRCLDCSWRALCPDCHLALSPRGPAWVCRYCGHSEPAKTLCQRCQSVRLQPVGFGIQRLVQSLTREFPESKISVIEKNAPAGSLEKSNFVIATSSVFRTNLPSIHLAAIISLESELQQTEWWSREQALTTVKKVAGLSPSIERVIVQTRLENELSENLLKDSTTTLVRPELLDRQRFGFPPFVQLVKVSLRVENGDPLSQAEKLVELLRARKKDFPKLFSITPPSVYRSGKKGKVILLLKLNKNTSAEERTDLLRSVPDDWTIDVRPLQLGA